MSEKKYKRRVTVYECINNGYVIHDADHHKIHVYENVEKVIANKTAIEVMREL